MCLTYRPGFFWHNCFFLCVKKVGEFRPQGHKTSSRMTHEKIFKRKDGSQVKVSVWLYVHQMQCNWGYIILVQEPDSDRWFDPFSDRDYITRIVKPKNRESGLKLDTFDNYVTKKEILQTKMELWEMIRPS